MGEAWSEQRVGGASPLASLALECPPRARPLGFGSCYLSERRCLGASTCLLLNFSSNLTRRAQFQGGGGLRDLFLTYAVWGPTRCVLPITQSLSKEMVITQQSVLWEPSVLALTTRSAVRGCVFSHFLLRRGPGNLAAANTSAECQVPRGMPREM